MRTYDFSPLYRSTVGFDRLFDMLEGATRVEPMTNYPPYNAEWQVWSGFFPPERGRVGQPATVPTRTFLDALLWMTGEGARWRALPERFGPWNTIWRRFARWRDQGVFEAAFEAISRAGLADERVRMLDSTVIRAHQHAAGARRVKGGAQAPPWRSGVHAGASRLSSTSEPTRTGCRSPLP